MFLPDTQVANLNFYDQNVISGFVFGKGTPMTVSCPLLLSGNKQEMLVAQSFKRTTRIPSFYYSYLAKNCSLFKSRRNYMTSSLTLEEEQFPIAYSMVVYKDVEQVERLLRSIYRPQNIYCVHLDNKSEPEFRETLTEITNCFQNVFVSKESLDVRWGTMSVLEADLICMHELWKYKSWKYFINLTGQEFPLKTNAEIVRILKNLNGKNNIRKSVLNRWATRWEKAGKAPAGIIPVKGDLQIAVNREFVDYVLHNKTAKKFLKWCSKTKVPDETFFVSLHYNKHLNIGGSYTDDQGNSTDPPYITRFKTWEGTAKPCHGKYVRRVCVYGVGDLPLLINRKELFVNKLHLDFEPLALDCLEETLYNVTRNEYFQTLEGNGPPKHT